MNQKTKKMVGVGLLTAIVVVLQSLAVIIPVGIFNLNLVLVPIVVGAALYGVAAGAWLGFVSAMMILFTNAGAFLAVSVIGTIITVLGKGMGSGLVAGLVYQALKKVNLNLSVICAAIVCPVVNTAVFLLGCWLFFLPTITGWGEAWAASTGKASFSVVEYMLVGLVGTNFLIELAISIVLSSTIVRIVQIGKSGR